MTCPKCGTDGVCWTCWGEDGYYGRPIEAEDGRPLDPAMNPKAKDRRDEDYV